MKLTYNQAIAFILWSATNLSNTIHTPVKGAGAGWCFFAAVHEISTKYMALYSDSSGSLALREEDTYTHTYSAPDNPKAARPVLIGTDQASTGARSYFDAFTIFDKALSADEIAWLYNSGAGRAYADFS